MFVFTLKKLMPVILPLYFVFVIKKGFCYLLRFVSPYSARNSSVALHDVITCDMQRPCKARNPSVFSKEILVTHCAGFND